MIKFPSIEQYRNAIKNVEFKSRNSFNENGEPVFNRAAPLPKLNFHGTVKLHGTNGAIVIRKDSIQYQSRERILSLEEDNAGFMEYMTTNEEAIKFVKSLQTDSLDNFIGDGLAIFGEWCGGNIQKGVGINGLPKMFVIFAVRVIGDDDNEGGWLNPQVFNFSFPNARIYNIEDFQTWDVCIDMEDPKIMQNTLSELTIKVEEECPVAKHFGNIGVGEGIVWKCQDEGWNSSKFWFKVKGEKHSASKVTKLASVDMEKHAKLTDFVASVVTDARCEQGLQNLVNEQLKPFEMQSMGDFIRWIVGDVMKEEKDTIEVNGFDRKQLGSPISDKARKWYVEALNKT